MKKIAWCCGVLGLLCSVATGQVDVARDPGPRVRVVGLAQDGGLPHAGCVCERCEDARENPERAAYVACLAIIVPDEELERDRVYLIDATPDLREQLVLLADVRDAPEDRADREPIDGVFLTHAHMGHYTGLMFFGFEALHTQNLPVWCTPKMAGYLRENGPWSQLVGMNNIELREIEPWKMRALEDEPENERVLLEGGVRVRAIKVPHRDELSDTVGYIIEGARNRVLYIPDTEPWREWDRSLGGLIVGEGISVAILDGCFYSGDELPGRAASEIGHPLMVDTMDELDSLVENYGLEVIFTHLNHSNPALTPGSAERAEIERRGFSVAEQGQEIEL